MFRFRVTAHHPTPGFFRINEGRRTMALVDGVELTLAARDAPTLAQATRYHFEGRAFATEEGARTAGERLRQSLHVLVGMFGLTLIVPSVDGEDGKLAEAEKARIREQGLEVLNSRTGVSVLPDDENCVEFVAAGLGEVTPSDPEYVLKAIESVWPLELVFDDVSKRALETVSFASSAASPLLKFLTMYMAVEQLLNRVPTSEPALAPIDELIETLRKTALPETEKAGLISALGNLKGFQPFSATFRKFAELNPEFPKLRGLPLSKLASDSIKLRNNIAHRVQADPRNAEELAGGLRELALALVWSRNQLPTVTLERPADRVAMTKLEFRLL
ncbi:MAG: hypothetical protein K0R38_2706 [Polyangiaceae bacterium]|jgi:hypothetical protein|nr:hypothetical protein [Polyangiaceae bacterium]